MDYFIFAIICFFGGILSSLVGVGGGVLVLSLILTMTPFLVGSSIHSIVMLVGNIQKAIMLKEHIKREIIFRFITGAIPGALAGAYIVSLIPDHVLYLIFGIFLLLFCAMEFFKSNLKYSVHLNDFYWVGGMTGISAGILGAPGPIHAPFFLRYGLTKEAFIGTAAVTTIIVHISKLSVFFRLGIFTQIDPWFLILGVSTTFVGIWLGIVLLRKINPETFRKMIVIILALLGTYYIVKASNQLLI